MEPSRRRWLGWLILAAAVLVPWPVAAQSALERPPNLSGAWVGRAGVAHFHFVHRFMMVGDVDKVVNAPSFLLAAGLPGRTLAGAVYTSNSDVSPEFRPNEWELFARWQPVGGAADAPVRLTTQLGYNTAAESVDGEVAAAGELGALSLFGALRVLGRPYGVEGARAALGGGAAWRLGRWVAVAGDVASLLDRGPREEVAWSAGLLLGIPYSPHTLSLHATNAGVGTLQGLSRGGADVRWGFEFTVPLTLGRYFGGEPEVVAKAVPPSAPAGADTVHVAIEGIEYVPARIEVAPGTTVVWTNRAPLAHTVTADDAGWESPLLGTDGVWSYTFTEAGAHPYHCAPHPFMKGVVVVGAETS